MEFYSCETPAFYIGETAGDGLDDLAHIRLMAHKKEFAAFGLFLKDTLKRSEAKGCRGDPVFHERGRQLESFRNDLRCFACAQQRAGEDAVEGQFQTAHSFGFGAHALDAFRGEAAVEVTS